MRAIGFCSIITVAWLWWTLPVYAAKLSPADAVSELNALRAMHGIPASVTENPQLSAACLLHAKYMSHVSFGHEEDPSSSYYTAEGANAGGSSVIAYSTAGDEADLGPSVFVTMPYHLAQVLEPEMTTTGFGQYNGNSCLVTRNWIDGEPSLAEVPPGIYAYPGSDTIVESEIITCGENPTNTVTDVGLDCASAAPVIITWFANSNGEVSSTAPDGITLTDGTTNLAVRQLHQGVVHYTVPEKPFRKRARYFATATYGSTTRSWSFQTAGIAHEISIDKVNESNVMYLGKRGLRVTAQAAALTKNILASLAATIGVQEQGARFL